MKIATIASVVTLAFAAAAANAQVTISQQPGHPQGDENVLFNNSSLAGSGNFVQGTTNQSHNTVDFTSTSNLVASGGQAMITGAGGSNFNDLTLNLDGAGSSFTNLVMNLDAVNNGNVTFNVNTTVGSYNQTFDVNQHGQNFFQFSAGNGVGINSISFNSNVGIQDVKQVRINGCNCNCPTPEPASLLGLGLGVVAFVRKRKASKA